MILCILEMFQSGFIYGILHGLPSRQQPKPDLLLNMPSNNSQFSLNFVFLANPFIGFIYWPSLHDSCEILEMYHMEIQALTNLYAVFRSGSGSGRVGMGWGRLAHTPPMCVVTQNAASAQTESFLHI